MKTLPLLLFLLGICALTTNNLPAQDLENQALVKNIYNALQDKNKSPGEVANLMPQIDWNEISLTKGVGSKTGITLSGIMDHSWVSLEIRDLHFEHPRLREVEVTGIINGRRPTECEYISSPFRHRWRVHDGNIISFAE